MLGNELNLWIELLYSYFGEDRQGQSSILIILD